MTPLGTDLREALGRRQGGTTRKQSGELQSQKKGKPRGCSSTLPDREARHAAAQFWSSPLLCSAPGAEVEAGLQLCGPAPAVLPTALSASRLLALREGGWEAP